MSAQCTRWGWHRAHSSARMPPIDPPTTAAQARTPRALARGISAATWSRIVIAGHRLPHRRPSGASEAGPVEPWQPPSAFGHTTNHRSVSIPRPGPTTPCHQRARVDHQRPDVADVGQMVAQLHGLNERPARSAATPHTELGAATREPLF